MNSSTSKTVRDTHWLNGYRDVAKHFQNLDRGRLEFDPQRIKGFLLNTLHNIMDKSLRKRKRPTPFYDGGAIDATLDAFN